MPGRAAFAPFPSRWPAMPRARRALRICPGSQAPRLRSDAAHVDAAIDFVLAVNARPARRWRRIRGLLHALPNISRRWNGASSGWRCSIRRAAPVREVQPLVSMRLLLPAWSCGQARLTEDARDAGLSIDRALRADECCLSPSDFGFHNALVDERAGLTFLDFEYAGRDDPAKLVSDFFCQPEIPVPLDLSCPTSSTRMARWAGAGRGRPSRAVARCSTPTASNGAASS